MTYYALLTLTCYVGPATATSNWLGTFTGPVRPEDAIGHLRGRAIQSDPAWGTSCVAFFGIWPAELP